VTKSVFTREYKEFRRMLVEARAAAGLSQRDLAKQLGRPHSFVANYELGERRLDVIEFIEIARALKKRPVSIISELEAMEFSARHAPRKKTK
jgi:transcriptional regulator with XRE-family HTH domain